MNNQNQIKDNPNSCLSEASDLLGVSFKGDKVDYIIRNKTKMSYVCL